MAILSREELLSALKRLGELADERGEVVRLVIVGGAAMVLALNARQTTRDVDAVFVNPPDAHRVRELVRRVAGERNWPEDWLNDAAKGYLVGVSEGQTLLTAPGVEVRIPSLAQLLAMKLSAWRDDVDIADAHRLMIEIGAAGGQERMWESLRPFLIAGSELKARYAFLDLWEELYGNA